MRGICCEFVGGIIGGFLGSKVGFLIGMLIIHGSCATPIIIIELYGGFIGCYLGIWIVGKFVNQKCPFWKMLGYGMVCFIFTSYLISILGEIITLPDKIANILYLVFLTITLATGYNFLTRSQLRTQKKEGGTSW